jgi:hypothetical protein
MNLKDGATVVADLTTTGRKSGLPRTVELRVLFFKGTYYHLVKVKASTGVKI